MLTDTSSPTIVLPRFGFLANPTALTTGQQLLPWGCRGQTLSFCSAEITRRNSLRQNSV